MLGRGVLAVLALLALGLAGAMADDSVPAVCPSVLVYWALLASWQLARGDTLVPFLLFPNPPTTAW